MRGDLLLVDNDARIVELLSWFLGNQGFGVRTAGLLPPTLVVSGFLDDKVQAALFSVQEVLDTLPKPFEFPDLEAKVVACLAGEVERPRAFQVAERVAPSVAPSADVGSVSAVDDDDDDDGWIEITPGG